MIPDDPIYKEFPRIWRFCDATKYTQLSLEEFGRFHPQPQAQSLRLWQQYVYSQAKPFGRHLLELVTQKCLELPDEFSFRSESEEEERQICCTTSLRGADH